MSRTLIHCDTSWCDEGKKDTVSSMVLQSCDDLNILTSIQIMMEAINLNYFAVPIMKD